MLKLLEFRALSSAEKAAYVLEHGQYIHFRIKGWCKIDLYLVKSGPGATEIFYAELWYYYDLKSVGLVRVFEAAPPLEPYTENIQLRFSGK
ncbi:hypothetical protein I5M27_17850 [Adhaeribacter sp. BT258]|uniref:Uncharacterized protein n=1 Tax=Adhaeribacter terrigena TaxID=2793070 RepID=A0ABS1C656_9BACT|nr:hypothetical protein [Adhaeribacter terrigena]MBK0404860.1 hypothetical protein [Adhaeribacter terrigena]